jgi:hypothetical protein
MGAQDGGTELGESRFQLASIDESLPQEGHERTRHVHTAAAPLVREREDERRMLLTRSTAWAVRTDTGFTDFGEGTFGQRPEVGELLEKLFVELVCER